jgi:putative methyltransferase (TIGR04325 family)
MALKNFIPPIVLNFGRSLRRSFVRVPIYDSYARALAECGAGYSADKLCTVVLEKTKAYRAALNAEPVSHDGAIKNGISLAAGVSIRGKTIRVLDFGGGCGGHYFLFRRLVGRDLRIDWHVVETERMVAVARELETEELHFHPSHDIAAKTTGSDASFDLTLSCSALQYVDDPLRALNQLIDIRSRHIFITRVGMTVGEVGGMIFKQTSKLRDNGPGTYDGIVDAERDISYPVTLLGRNTYEAVIRTKYEIVWSACEEPAAYYVNGESVGYYGIYGQIAEAAGCP